MKIKLTAMKLGDVLINNGIKFVCVKIDNREERESIVYDRTYCFVEYNELLVNMKRTDVHIYGNFSKIMETSMRDNYNPTVEICDSPIGFDVEIVNTFTIKPRK